MIHFRKLNLCNPENINQIVSFLSANIQTLFCPFYGLYVINNSIQCSGLRSLPWTAQKITCELKLDNQEEIKDTWFGFDFLSDYMKTYCSKS